MVVGFEIPDFLPGPDLPPFHLVLEFCVWPGIGTGAGVGGLTSSVWVVVSACARFLVPLPPSFGEVLPQVGQGGVGARCHCS